MTASVDTKPRKERKVKAAVHPTGSTALAHSKAPKVTYQAKADTSVGAVQVTGEGFGGQDRGTAPKDNALGSGLTLGPTKILEQSSQESTTPPLTFDQALRKAQSHRSHTLLNLFHAHFAETQDAQHSLSLARRQLGL